MADRQRVVVRDLAQRDIETAVDWYRDAGVDTALGFVDALDTELDLPGLRAWRLDGFPDLVFCVVPHHHLDVWRVLHGRCDLPAWLGPPDHEA